MSLEHGFNQAWYQGKKWTQLFRPLLPLVSYYVKSKRKAYLQGDSASYRAPVPVIVVGNITVGGTGKSPMVIALCQFLRVAGYRPGIISRGYGASATQVMAVHDGADPSIVGDEPMMLAKRTACPVVIGRQRAQAAKMLLDNYDVNLIISDDGLQHYALTRDIEIVMLDQQRGVGNGALLPVGPLREPIERLQSADFVVSASQSQANLQNSLPACIAPLGLQNFHTLPLLATQLVNLRSNEVADFALLKQQKHWTVCAGIGNPQRFLDTLKGLGLGNNYTTLWWPDHHKITVKDIPAKGPTIMTEKDAVKCHALAVANEDVWYLTIELTLTELFKQTLMASLSALSTCELNNK